MPSDSFLVPDWPVPANVKSLVTTREGGISEPPYDSFNLGSHVGDEVYAVNHNRKLLAEAVGGKKAFQWVRQEHGSDVLVLDSGLVDESREADAIYTRQDNIACGVLTADCLSVFFCDETGSEIAVAHAGWRGLANGVLQNTLAQFDADPATILAWLGPVIGPCHFEVGNDVRDAFLALGIAEINNEAGILFQAGESRGKWMADLFALAKIILAAQGIQQIHGEPLCTWCEFDRFYSYRRDGDTGRFASIIWKE
jgi:hypothetical protein